MSKKDPTFGHGVEFYLRGRPSYGKEKVFKELKGALEDALRYERGQQVNLRTTELSSPAKRITPQQIREIRQQLNASQVIFAKLMNLSPNTVESWE